MGSRDGRMRARSKDGSKQCGSNESRLGPKKKINDGEYHQRYLESDCDGKAGGEYTRIAPGCLSVWRLRQEKGDRHHSEMEPGPFFQ